MGRIKNFVNESYSELMTKVSWPTWDELQSSAIIVSIAALIIALIVVVMDIASNAASSFYYKLF